VLASLCDALLTALQISNINQTRAGAWWQP
jgi:hypothetical protein